MSYILVVTDAGRTAIVNATQTGTNAVTVAEIGLSATALVPTSDAAVLPDEIKRLPAGGSQGVAIDTIHVTAVDTSDDTYDVRSFAFYLDDGTLFAIYGQALAVFEKATASQLYLAIDVKFADILAAQIEFGDTNFSNPPASTEISGTVELATDAETIAGVDAQRAVTPHGLWSAFLSWLASDAETITGTQTERAVTPHGLWATVTNWLSTKLVWGASNDGSGSGLDADLLDGRDSTEFVLHTDAATEAVAGVIEIASDAETITGTDGLRAVSPKSLWAGVANWLSIRTVWGLSNDGSGSGLDADTIDGFDSSDIVMKANIMTDLAAAMNETGSVGGLPHYEFELGDLLIQVGWSMNVAANATALVVFPRAFSSQPWAGAFRRTAGAITNADSGAGIEGTPSINSMTVRNTTAGCDIDIAWLAIGKK